jgi:hypothetical protein
MVYKATRDYKAVVQKHNNKTHTFSKLPSGSLHACHETLSDRYFQAAGEVQGPAPHRECGFRLCVCVCVCVCVCGVANLLTKELEAAHAIRLRFYQDKELNITAHMSKAA